MYEFANIFDRKLKDINKTNIGNKKRHFKGLRCKLDWAQFCEETTNREGDIYQIGILFMRHRCKQGQF